ncbi:S1C family serine protease [Nocardioides sp. GXZ039]|uniref:S1C family serine protease n=1 Tax=Nocardioides sp. GXZ039 TaxID=3136018 RepID=UPI0030F48997
MNDDRGLPEDDGLPPQEPEFAGSSESPEPASPVDPSDPLGLDDDPEPEPRGDAEPGSERSSAQEPSTPADGDADADAETTLPLAGLEEGRHLAPPESGAASETDSSTAVLPDLPMPRWAPPSGPAPTPAVPPVLPPGVPPAAILASGPLPARPSGPWDDYGRSVHPFGGQHSMGGPIPARPAGPAKGLWIGVALIALVVGLLGGVGGSALWDAGHDDGNGGDNGQASAYEGLSDDSIVEVPPVEPGEGVAAVAAAVLPSTVQIIAEYQGDPQGATGSGFVIDVDGHIVTNNHVVQSAAENDGPVQVIDQEGNAFDAEIVGRSPVYDLAVLAVPESAGLEPAALGASRSLRVGDGVVAIGSPLGLTATVTSGIVSALNRPVTTGGQPGDESSYINAVQTDAAINPGNSGGPLVNMRGQVIGVNSAIATAGGVTNGEAGNIGVGFAIPVEQVRITADQILKTGEARYPVIGAEVGPNGSGPAGARISRVNTGTPAEQAGLQAGDVVTEVDGQRVVDGISLIVSIRAHQPGETVDFTYVRGGQEKQASITLDSEVG